MTRRDEQAQRPTLEELEALADTIESEVEADIEERVVRREAGRAFPARKVVLRGLAVILAGVALYLLLPSMLEVFSSWRELVDLNPWWLLAMPALELGAILCLWKLQEISLRSDERFAIATSQLAGGALGRIVPAGMAVAGGLQYRMLTRAGLPPAATASGLTLASILTFSALLVMPVASLPAILGGTPVDAGLTRAALLGGGVFLLTFATGTVLMLSERALIAVGRAVQAVVNLLRRGRPVQDLHLRLLAEQRHIRRALGRAWVPALALSVARWAFDYAVLLAALAAAGADPNVSLVVLAYVAAQFLGMLPVTPGGLGFVEAGLTGTLVLTGVGAAVAAVATLAYRLVSYWLPIPAGLGAYLFFRRRYPEPVSAEA